jgi:hypothetical protein
MKYQTSLVIRYIKPTLRDYVMNTPTEPSTHEAVPALKAAIAPDEPNANSKVADTTSEPATEKQPKRGGVFTKGLNVCGNCGTQLLGETCYQCGQPTKGLVRQFSSIMGDFLDTVLNIDTRVFRTLGPLIVKPGFLTQEYFSGRRIRYVSPVRLFFFLAVLTFLLAQFSLPETMGSNEGNDIIKVNVGGQDDIDKAKTIEDVEKLRAQALSELKDARKEVASVPMAAVALEKAETQINGKADKRIADLRDEMAVGVAENASSSIDKKKTDVDKEKGAGGNISFNGEMWDAEKNPIKVEWLPAYINKWFNSLAQRAEKNGKLVNKDPKVIIEAVLSSLPMTLFLMLPLFALLLKIMFIFKRRLYMEHLVVALHSHAFLMLAILLLIMFNDISAWFSAYAWVTVPLAILSTALWIWMPIYLFLMQKRVYQQGWILTFIKYTIIGNCHIVLLSIAITFTLAIKMIWL